MAQSVERPTSAQAMISRFVSSSPMSGSALTSQSLEPASNSVSPWGAWVAQSVKRLISTQVMISWSVGLSPTSGSVLRARSLEPGFDSVSLSLSALPLLTLCLSQK